MIYRIKWFFKRLRRAFKYFWFIFKQPAWVEYDQSINLLKFHFEEMIAYFEKNIDHPFAYIGIQNDIRWMKMFVHLVTLYQEEYYSMKYIEEGMVENEEFERTWKEGYSGQQWFEEMYKDEKAFRIALKILQYKLKGWWI